MTRPAHRISSVLTAVLWACCALDAPGAGLGDVRALRVDHPATKGAPVPDRPDARPNELLIRFKPGRELAAIDQLEAAGTLRVVWTRKLKAGNCRLVKVASSRSLKQLVQACRRSPDILLAEPNYRIRIARNVPNDTSFSRLWGLDNTGQTGGVADADIDAPEAWDLATSSSVIVAVIDTGVDYGHPDLAANMWSNPGEIPANGIDDDGNGFIDDVHGWDFANNDSDPMDDEGHGTHCAGTIGAVGNNGIGVAGVCWNVKLMALKFLDASGSGAVTDAIDAIAYATQMGAKVLSNSWGGGGYSQALKDAIAAADGAGALFVAAAGNDYGNDNDANGFYPASYDNSNVIAVAATTDGDGLAAFSNIGAVSVDLGAPGQSIYSTVPDGGYGTKSGTSMATPHVAGACALVWAAGGAALSHSDVKAAILAGIDPLAALQGRCATGGRLNLRNALDVVASGRHLILLGPNGGQGFEQGAIAEITWDAYGADWQPADQLCILYSADDGAHWDPIPDAQALDYDDRSFLWDTAGLPTGSLYRVRIELVGDPSVNDASDDSFAITDPFDHFDFVMPSPQPNQRVVQGSCTVTAKDANGNTISSFGTAHTDDRFPVTITALDVTIGGLRGAGNELMPEDFTNGTANLNLLGMTIAVAAPPLTVQFTAESLDGRTGTTASVVIDIPCDYFTELFDPAPLDLEYRSVIFEPDGSADCYAAYTQTIAALPTDPTGGTVVSLGDDAYASLTISGASVSLYGVDYTILYIGSNGYVTFGSGDASWQHSLDAHFSMPRVSALFNDFYPTEGQVSVKLLPDRAAVTYNGVAQYDTTNSNTFQIELYFDGRIVLSYLGMDTELGIAGLSEGNGVPTDCVASDLSAYPPLPGRFLTLREPNGGEAFESGQTLDVSWIRDGSGWQAGDTARLDYSTTGGASWNPIPGAQTLDVDAGSFAWDTTGLPVGATYRVRVVATSDADIHDASDGDFALTGPLDHFHVHLDTPQSNGRVVHGTCTVAAKDASGTTITSFGTHNTAERFPVTISAAGVVITGLPSGTNQLTTGDFADGVADLVALGMVPEAASAPVTVQFAALGADGTSGLSDLVTIERPPDYFTEGFDTSPFDLQHKSVIFIPDGSAGFYSAFTEDIAQLPTDPAGGTPLLDLVDDEYQQVTLTGATVSLYGINYGSFYVGTNGYVTFGQGDEEYVETAREHFRLPRISGLFDDLYVDIGEISWKQLSDRAVVTYQDISEYDPPNSNTVQIEMHFDGRIVLSYLAIDSNDGLAGLSEGQGLPDDFENSDLSAYPPLGARRIIVTAPNGGRNYEPGDLLDLTWLVLGTDWLPTDAVRIDYTDDDGAHWYPIPGAQALDHDLGSFAWDTTGLALSSHYRVAVTFIDDNAVTDESDTSFGLIADTEPPVITHTPLPDTSDDVGPYRITAVVTDNLGVDMVVLYWRHNDGSFTPVGMTPTSSQNEYEGSIPGPATLGDRFEYYIEALDTSSSANVASDPDVGVHTFEIIAGPQLIRRFTLDTDPGWTTEGLWAYGEPTGDGTAPGDPTSGYSGANVYGYNLYGDYPNDMPGPAYLTTTAIDCSGVTGIVLKFRRWLAVEFDPFDKATVDVSNDGNNWTTVWENPADDLTESDWSLQTYDISAVADDQPAVYIRWGMGPTDDTVTYPGWNLDDIEIWSDPAGAGPDLIIESMTHAPIDAGVGETVTFDIVVKNDGTAPAGPFSIAFWVDAAGPDGVPDLIQDVSTGLAPGDSTTLQIHATLGTWGQYTAWAYADFGQTIAESDETNNADSEPWTLVGEEVQLDLAQGWNLIALPVDPAVNSVDEFFPPDVASAVWEYNNPGGYAVPSEIRAKKGYWVLAASAVSLFFEGRRPDNCGLPLSQGWNLVGAVAGTPGGTLPVPPSPPVAAIWQYDNPGGYAVPTVCQEKKGFWMLATYSAGVW